jgi:hypothetical protein
MNVEPVVSAHVLQDGVVQAILPSAVEYPDKSTVIIRFTSPRAGIARLA